MKHYKIYNSPVNLVGETFLKLSNPYPKILIKEGLTNHNPSYDAFESESIKNATVIINPIDGRKGYTEHELKNVWQFFDTVTERWLISHKEPNSNKKRLVFEFVGDKNIIPESTIIKVYVASPYTLGDVAVNVKAQMEAADELMNLGFAPFVPLYSHFQHMAYPRPYEDWIKFDKAWVLSCDALYRFGGESKGADGEVDLAKSVGIPVFYSIEDLIEHFDNDTRDS